MQGTAILFTLMVYWGAYIYIVIKHPKKSDWNTSSGESIISLHTMEPVTDIQMKLIFLKVFDGPYSYYSTSSHWLAIEFPNHGPTRFSHFVSSFIPSGWSIWYCISFWLYTLSIQLTRSNYTAGQTYYVFCDLLLQGYCHAWQRFGKCNKTSCMQLYCSIIIDWCLIVNI